MIEAVYNIIAITSCLVTGLRDVRVTVPRAARRGDSVVLHCHYNMEDDTLYAVKWYKGQAEFFRYTPEENPPWTLFHIPGLLDMQVDTSKSNESQLFLTSVTSAMSGKYSCEVLTDSPSFLTGGEAANMEVVEVPLQPPVLTVADSKLYRSRDRLVANCTASPSRPAVNLTWGLNGENVNPKWLKQFRRVPSLHPELEESGSLLEVTLKSYHVTSGRLKVRCTASLYDLYWQTTEAVVNTDKEVPAADKNGWDDYYDEYDSERGVIDEGLLDTSKREVSATTRTDATLNIVSFEFTILFTTCNILL